MGNEASKQENLMFTGKPGGVGEKEKPPRPKPKYKSVPAHEPEPKPGPKKKKQTVRDRRLAAAKKLQAKAEAAKEVPINLGKAGGGGVDQYQDEDDRGYTEDSFAPVMSPSKVEEVTQVEVGGVYRDLMEEEIIMVHSAKPEGNPKEGTLVDDVMSVVPRPPIKKKAPETVPETNGEMPETGHDYVCLAMGRECRCTDADEAYVECDKCRKYCHVTACRAVSHGTEKIWCIRCKTKAPMSAKATQRDGTLGVTNGIKLSPIATGKLSKPKRKTGLPKQGVVASEGNSDKAVEDDVINEVKDVLRTVLTGGAAVKAYQYPRTKRTLSEEESQEWASDEVTERWLNYAHESLPPEAIEREERIIAGNRAHTEGGRPNGDQHDNEEEESTADGSSVDTESAYAALRLRGGGGRWKYRWLATIRAMQKSTELQIPRAPMKRLIQELTNELTGGIPVNYTKEAVECIRQCAEDFIVEVIQDAYIVTLHCDRVTLKVRDMTTANRVKKLHSLDFIAPDVRTQKTAEFRAGAARDAGKRKGC